MMRGSRFLLAMLLAAAAACGGDGQPEAGGARSGESSLPGDEPYVSPRDSAAAAEAVQRRTDSLRDSVLRASGGEPERPRRRPRSAGRSLSVEERYRACVQQVERVEEPARTRLLAACANIRNQPEK